MACDAESPVQATARKGVGNSHVCGADGARLNRVEGGATTLTIRPTEVRDHMAANEAPITDPHPSFRRENDERAHLHRDHLVSIQLIMDAQGAEAEERTYRPFGEERLVSSNTIAPETKGFVGERYDDTARLQYLNARYYDPVLGVFTSPDWFEVTTPSVGTNRYAYAGNDPVNVSDPGGNCPSCVGAAIGGLAGLAGQALSDWARGEWSSAQDYAASAAAGAVVGGTFGLGGAGAATLYGGMMAGGAAGVTGTVTDSVVRDGAMPTVGQMAVGAVAGAVTGGAGGKLMGLIPANKIVPGITFTRRQLQHGFKHARDFGIVENANNRTLAEFSSAIQNHIAAPGTRAIQGTYRGQAVTHFVDPKTGLNVIRDSSSNFLSGWRLSPQQLEHVRTTG